MTEENTLLLIEKIGDSSISSLADISQLTYSAFLRRTEKSLSLAESHHLYQQAIYSRESLSYWMGQLRTQKNNNPEMSFSPTTLTAVKADDNE